MRRMQIKWATSQNEQCHICCGVGWVCESHSHKPWDKSLPNGCECGPGIPCKCNRSLKLPPGSEVICAVEGFKVDKWAH